MTDYQGVLGLNTILYEVSRSKFIATATNVSSHSEALDFIRDISKNYNDATHNCYAYISNPEMSEMRFSDDGEPQGTAGQPILEVLKKKEIACTAVVVTRYYGGIKLGTGGLVAAYTKAAKDCIESANIVDFKLSDYYKVTAHYSMRNKIEQAVKASGGEVVDIMYLEDVELLFAVPKALSDVANERILSVTSARCKIEHTDTKYYIYK